MDRILRFRVARRGGILHSNVGTRCLLFRNRRTPAAHSATKSHPHRLHVKPGTSFNFNSTELICDFIHLRQSERPMLIVSPDLPRMHSMRTDKSQHVGLTDFVDFVDLTVSVCMSLILDKGTGRHQRDFRAV